MANTSAEELASALAAVLHYGNGTGSVNLYMAHGGSNWGFWAGKAAESLDVPLHAVVSSHQEPSEVMQASVNFLAMPCAVACA